MATAKAPYRPHRDSVPGRVIAFFQANPDEELTVADIIEKFETGASNVHNILGPAVQAGLLKRHQNNDLEYVYELATRKAQPALRSVGSGSPFVGKPSGHATRRHNDQVLATFDPAKIAIEDGVPVPSRGPTARSRVDLSPLLQRLKPGQSACLPIAARYGLVKAVTDLHKAGKPRYTTRANKAAGEIRVWRIS